MKEDRVYLIHIRECIERIEHYTEAGRDVFLSDTKTQDAVLRNLHTLSESTQRLSQALKASHPEVDWRGISGFRNILVHDYLGVNLVRVWELVERDLPDLKAKILDIMQELGVGALRGGFFRMEIKQVQESLLRVFAEEKKRIVFWYDGEREFEEMLPALKLDGISILRLDEIGPLALKIQLELEDPEGRYLVYSPQPEPEQKDDWLLDVRLYSKTFHADRASILLNELGLNQQSLRPYLTQRKKFFQNQERLNRLKKWVSPGDGEADLDLKMLAVVVRADQPEIFSISDEALFRGSGVHRRGRFGNFAQALG